MKILTYITVFILASFGLAPAQELRVDSVSVDSVWNSDSSWTLGGAAVNRKSRDCTVSFYARGGGIARIYVALSLDSGKTFSFAPESLKVLEGYTDSLPIPINEKQIITVRVLGGDRQGIAFRLTARQSAPKILGRAKGLVLITTPGQNAMTTLTINSSQASKYDGFCYFARTYVDASGDGVFEDSSAEKDPSTLTCNTAVPAPGQASRVIVKGKDRNGLWSAPETLSVEVGLVIDAAYRSIASQVGAGGSGFFNHWMIGDIVSDDAEKGGEAAADLAELLALRDFKTDAKNSIIAAQWYTPFESIFYANRIIDSLPHITMDAALRARNVAEAKFLRAWSYFILMRTFGDVPLLTHSLSFKGYCQARSPRAQLWAQIETDCKEAASVLPEKSGYALADQGRATKGAANALLVKAYIYQKNFIGAKSLADTLIASGQYSLEPMYADIFTLSHENGVESVFEFQYSTDTTYAVFTIENSGQIISVFQGLRSDPEGGWGFDCPTQNLVNEFEAGDPRRGATIVAVGDRLRRGTPKEWIVTQATWTPTGYNAKKYLNEYHYPPTPILSNPANWRAIRYSDVLLFAAEASNEVDNPTDALKYLNMVRSRVGLSAVVTTDKDSLRTAIFHERRVELALEGNRFWDVVRQGNGAAVFGARGFKAGIHEVFPIPQTAIDACNTLTQNSGY
jgi:hypothetical protein